MKRLRLPAGGLLLILATSAAAVDTTDYSVKGMQTFIGQMNEMQLCMAQVDELEYSRFQSMLNDFSNRLPELCRDDSMIEIKSEMFAMLQIVSNSPAFQQISLCTEPLRASGFMPALPLLNEVTDSGIKLLCQKYR